LAAEVLPTWPGWARDYPTRAIFFEYSRTGGEIERLSAWPDKNSGASECSPMLSSKG
jgi:hypothetical protein